MLWQGRRESTNVEDRRGFGGKGAAVGGGIGAIIIAAIVYLMGGDPGAVLNNNPSASAEVPAAQQAADDSTSKFVKVVLADSEDIWGKLFNDMSKTYKDPTLVMFNNATQSAC